MAKGLNATDIQKLARMGAAARLAQLDREIAALRKAFPGLKPATDVPPPAPGDATPPRQAGSTSRASRRGRKKPMSAAERKAVSERMKRYWADRRKGRN